MVNGVEDHQVSALDRGLHFGDGVFRTMRVEDDSPRDWERHIRHLLEDARRIGLVLPSPGSLARQAEKACKGQARAVLKIILTRGQANRGYHFSKSDTSCILLLYSMPEHPAQRWHSGIRARVCDMRLSQNPRLAGIKHLNRLEQVLARAEWSDPEIAEGLMLDTGNRLIEGVSSNLFLVSDGVLLTAELSRCGVAGVTREMILEQAPAYTKALQIRELTLDDLYKADECFVCNSVIGIWPMTQLDDKRWPIGPVTRNLQHHFGDTWQPVG